MIAVVGSANMDVVIEVPHIPRPGETVLAEATHRFPGGKGANQAVAAARLGSRVAFFGKVGRDPFGEELLSSLVADGVDVSAVERAGDATTGMATILVDGRGENAIAYTPGANAAVDVAYIDRVFDRLAAADVILLQFEIPLESIAHLLSRLPEDRPTVIVDPAPAQDLSSLPLDRIDILTPNQMELFELTQVKDISAAASKLRERGVRTVLCKQGALGARWISEESFHVPAFSVEPLDTTAAGDAFNGALAGVLHSRDKRTAVRWANAAGALTTVTRGAQPSLPRKAEVQDLIDHQAGSGNQG